MFEIVISIFLALGIIFAYYVHVYLWKTHPLNTEQTKKELPNYFSERQTRHLVCCVSIYTLIVSCLYAALIQKDEDISFISVLKMQINFQTLFNMLKTILINSLLFLGPLLQYFFFGELWMIKAKLLMRTWTMFKKIHATSILEEMVFRVIIFGVLRQAGYTSAKVNLLTSVLFSISHGHNLVHVYKELGFLKGLGATIFQMFFTFIFAFYCGRIMNNYQSLYCAVILHSYCNALGFPDIGKLLQLSLKDWKTQVIWGGYILGVVGFFYII